MISSHPRLYVNALLTEARYVEALLRACGDFDHPDVYGEGSPFNVMMDRMRVGTNALEPAALFAQGCNGRAALCQKSGTGNCVFTSPSGRFAIMRFSDKGFLVTIGRWESRETPTACLKALLPFVDGKTFQVNITLLGQAHLESVSLNDALTKLQTM